MLMQAEKTFIIIANLKKYYPSTNNKEAYRQSLNAKSFLFSKLFKMLM